MYTDSFYHFRCLKRDERRNRTQWRISKKNSLLFLEITRIWIIQKYRKKKFNHRLSRCSWNELLVFKMFAVDQQIVNKSKHFQKSLCKLWIGIFVCWNILYKLWFRCLTIYKLSNLATMQYKPIWYIFQYFCHQ